MELVANIWPVVDMGTGMVLRYFARAYAIAGADEVISATLRALAPTDYCMARGFRIPDRFVVHSEHGSMRACVHISDFHEYQATIVEEALEALEKDFNRLQGVSGAIGARMGISLIPRFPATPYLMTTSLLEDADGGIVPSIQSAP